MESGGDVFYLNETSRWSYIVAHAGDNDIAVILVSTKGYDYEIPINYCPFCGRRLSSDE